ncbi:TIGR02996 domain-containing protein [Limnoglobus roseus]|uniref:TIGR02996 domain-containing protein n=1 Tax=Limnoglobus roseus TaxID=2598579 RepID=A0A5C1A937_9BACT|nr:TIGR02996 domain-containing protein [Limnoglobus roseus]QEL14312.1 TIGR02996 domain-containing protein [Limnoglobus roseus]
MTDDDAFVAAVKESPDDAVLRLVYADWLEERDDPRGRFLRLELEMVQRGEADPAYPALRQQLAEVAATVDVLWSAVVCRLSLVPLRALDDPPDDRPSVSSLDFFADYIQHLVEEEVPRLRADRRWEYAYFLLLIFWAVLVFKIISLFLTHPILLS